MHQWHTPRRPLLEEQLCSVILPLAEQDFMHFVGVGQPSRTHLAECLLRHVMPAMEERASALKSKATAGDKAALQELLLLDGFGYEGVLEDWLCVDKNIAPAKIQCDGKTPPELLTMPLSGLVSRLTTLHTGYRIILNRVHLNRHSVV